MSDNKLQNRDDTLDKFLQRQKLLKLTQENPKECTHAQLLELINKFSKVIGYEVNINILSVYTWNNYPKMELRKQFHLR